MVIFTVFFLKDNLLSFSLITFQSEVVFKSRFPDNQECNRPMHYVIWQWHIIFFPVFFQKSWMMKNHNFHHYYSTYKVLAAFKAKLGQFRPTSWFICISFSHLVTWMSWNLNIWMCKELRNWYPQFVIFSMLVKL